MNEMKAPSGEVTSDYKLEPIETKKSIDTVWTENLDKIEGHCGIEVLVNDNPDLLSKLIKALKDRAHLPCDFDNPETMTEVEAVNKYATAIYDVACEIANVAEAMMVGEQVEREYTNIMDEIGGTMSAYDMQVEVGHKDGDF